MKNKTIISIAVLGLISTFVFTNQLYAARGYFDEPIFRVANVSGNSHLNVRQGPGKNFRILKTLAPKTNRITILETRSRGRNQWARISWDNRVGWVSRKYLEEYSGLDLNRTYSVYTDDGASALNVRHGPGKNQRILRKLPNGTPGLKVLKTVRKGNDWWARVKWNGKIGWVHAYHLDEAQAEPTYYTVKAGDTLFAVMRNTGVDWEVLAEANDLPAPYSLSEGQKLQIPVLH